MTSADIDYDDKPNDDGTEHDNGGEDPAEDGADDVERWIGERALDQGLCPLCLEPQERCGFADDTEGSCQNPIATPAQAVERFGRMVRG